MSDTPPISFSGLASGLDVTSIITQYTTIAQKPIVAEQSQVTDYNSQLAAWQSFNTSLLSLQTATLALTQPSTYNAASATSSNSAVASITAQPGAQIGDHSLTVTQLAQAQKVVTGSFSSNTSALNLAGSFTLNGKTITLNATDALSDVAVKINAAGAGATAAVLNVGPNNYRLTLSANTTGTANSLSASDNGSGSLLSALGLASAPSVRQTVSPDSTHTGAASFGLASASQAVATQNGITDGGAASGTVQINGVGVAINLNTDSLNTIAANINAANIQGVTAQVLTNPNNSAQQQLQIVSSNTSGGNAVAPTFTDSGNVLSGLGIVQAASVRQTVAQDSTHSGVGSLALGSATQTVANTLGLTGTASGTVLIGGKPVAINLNTDSLNTIAENINKASIPGVTAQVVGLTDANGHVTQQQLQIVGGGTAPTLTDSNNILSTLGITQGSFATQITGAQDAKFNLDGLDITRPSNTVGDLVTGASISLLSAGTQSAPATTNLSITQNTDSIVQTVNSFVSAFNAVQDYITQQNQFTAPVTGTTGTAGSSPPLFGNTALTQIQDQLNKTLNAVSGTTTLGSIGLTLNTSNDLSLNTSTLTGVLQSNPSSVSSLFGLSGTADTSQIQYVSANAKTLASTGGGYTVNITQAATQSVATASVAQTTVSTGPETLTFGGGLFASPVSLTLTAGNALQDTVNQINANGNLNGKVYASISSAGQLVLASDQYGGAGSFTVASDQSADTAGHANSGLGTTPAIVAGKDVAGTINGEPATGNGRTLTGNAGNAHTEALQLLISATTPGSVGHVSVTHGIADAVNQALTQVMDPTSGAIIGAENSLNAQITDAQKQITQMQNDISAYTQQLQQTFSDMETRISLLQSQGAAFAAQTGTTSSSSSTTKAA